MSAAVEEVDRILELLTEKLERDLSRDEMKELKDLLSNHPEWGEQDLEEALCAAEIAYLEKIEPAPTAVKQMLYLSADQFNSTKAASNVADLRVVKSKKTPESKLPSEWLSWSGWMVAAAMILVTIALVTTEPSEELRPASQEARQSLLAQEGVKQWSWSTTEDELAEGVTGDVVWSDQRQEGYMHFKGLAQNDPTKNQYQLWIFDKNRSDKYPVDGGVFNIENNEAFVPIKSKIKVNEATLFAVTLEKPGGVVVSDRERLIVLAKAAQ